MSASNQLAIRHAQKSDLLFLLRLRNEKTAVEMFLSSKKVEPRQHSKWFLESLQSPDRKIAVVLFHGKPIAVLRTEKEASHHVVSINLSSDHRGLGLCKEILSMAFNFLGLSEAHLKAIVRRRNTGSLKCFRSLGFRVSDSSSMTISMGRFKENRN